jgi:hypothetical protein
MKPNLKEYGKICQCCFKKTQSRMYFRPSLAFKGKYVSTYKWRRLCSQCWDAANNNVI